MENDSEWSAISSLANNSIIQLSSLEIVTRTLPRNWWEMIATFEHLTRLRLVNQYGPFNLEDLIHSVRRCRQLQDLRLVGSIRSNNVEQSKSAESLTPSRCFTESLLNQIEPLASLSVLDLRFKDTDSLQDDFFLPFLKLAPNVKQLYPPQLSRTQAKSFVSAVQEYCRQIESLDLTSMVNLTDSDLAAIVKACTQESLRELLLNGSAIGQETMAAIVEHHAGSMEKLSIEQSLTPIPSASIQAVLANCTRLKEFKAGHQRWKGHVRLDAMDIIQAKWACQQHLETLAVCIVGCSTEALQNAVFEQLEQLTQLKNLDLSEMYNETQVDADKRGGSLVWAVGSGMDKLASLKRIEYFWILSGHFNLGEREKEWIYQHWPNLHKSAGVW
ncbi:hypothetical protein BGW42_006753 [Actinomortierella wolfii]|nr:hypothetical protein BGW42_006753 [Actinomortierella wolfii]